MFFLRAYYTSARCLLSQEGTMAEAVWEESRMDRLGFSTVFYPSVHSKNRKKNEWRKEKTVLCSAITVHPCPLCSLVKQEPAPFICDSAAPSIVPGWNWSSKQMHTLLNESMSDSSNQFNLAYAFLVGVPINYQLPMFTLQCVTIFLLASMNSLGWENWLLKWLPA